MTSENFVYWLQGYFELTGVETLTNIQIKIIKEHLALVLEKKTPTSKFLAESIYQQPTGHGILSC